MLTFLAACPVFVLDGDGWSMDCLDNSDTPRRSPFSDGARGDGPSEFADRPNILLNCDTILDFDEFLEKAFVLRLA